MLKKRIIISLLVLITFVSSVTGCKAVNNSKNAAASSSLPSSSPAAAPVSSAKPSPSPIPNIFFVVNESSYQLAPGIKYTKSTLSGKGYLDGKDLINFVTVIEADLTNPSVKLEVSTALDRVYARETVLNQALRAEKAGKRVVGAFNVEFFDVKTFMGVPRGVTIKNKEIISSPVSTAISLLIMDGGKVDMQFGGINMKSSLTSVDTGDKVSLDAVNRPRSVDDLKLAAKASNALVLMTDKFGEKTASAGSGVEAVIRPDTGSEKLQAGKTFTGTVESIAETENNTIPKGKMVLSASGTRADWVKTNLKTGSKISLQIDFDKGVNDAVDVISSDNPGTSLTLLDKGDLTAMAKDLKYAHNKDRAPRTMIGIKQGKLYIVTFDGRQPGYSDGITCTEGAIYLQSLGIEKAFNADGGGSTTSVAKLPGESLKVFNKPSDGEDRPVSNSLLIISTAAGN